MAKNISDLWKKEDWLAVWIGFLIIGLTVLAYFTGWFDVATAGFGKWTLGESVKEGTSVTPLLTQLSEWIFWKKVIINCTVNTVCALLRLKIIEVAEDPYGMELFRGVVREACAIATARGVPYDAVEFENTHLKNFIDNMGDYYPSMAQDMLQNHRQTEIDNLNGKLCEYGRQLGIPTPLNDVLVTEVKAIQANYDKQYLK